MRNSVSSGSSACRRWIAVAAGTAITASLLAWGSGPDVSARATVHPAHDDRDDQAELLLFAADGLVQDRVEAYAQDRRTVPGFRDLIRNGIVATEGGLLTQAPPNTGAGWNTLSTGAWPGVAGSTNNTFHVNGQPFGNSTSAFSTGVLQAETLAQAAERGGLRVAQIEWAGGRVGAIDGPTLDFRNFRSGRGVATNYISPNDSVSFTAAFGLQFDHPDGFAKQRAVPRGRAPGGDRLDQRPAVLQPGVRDADAGARRGDRQVRAERLHLRQQERPQDGVRPRPAVPHEERCRQGGRPPRGRVGGRQGDDPGQRPRRQDGRLPGQGRAPRSRPVRGPAVPHVGHPRHRRVADVAG